ncbi:MAG: YceI family protein [Vicinamibacterales bacterium]|jgi:polyisoprenoid-binding protein YceI|nr:YceI family protein [Vicinamibacterales bacterium]
MFRAFAVAAGLFLAAASSVQAQTWTIDSSHSAAQFAVRHMMVTTVRGDMGKISGTVTFDPSKPAAGSIEATVDVTAINTREAGRDKHLKSADFFDVEKFPAITFKSKRIDPVAAGGFKVTGDLTMRGVTKEAVLNVEPLQPTIKDQRGNPRTGTTATTKLNRQDFGVNWSRTLDGGGVVVSDEVSVTIDIQLIGAAPAAK